MMTSVENETNDRWILERFDGLFETIIEDLKVDPNLKAIPDASLWLEKVLRYNVPHGKKNRGVGVVKSFLLLTKPSEQTDENLKLASILGWCIELLQAFFLIADDIMDRSEMRRGQPCWYKKDDNGLLAFNDSILCEAAIYIILKKYFKRYNYYVELLEIFGMTTFQTSLGQCLDMLSNQQSNPNFEYFTKDHYASIVQYKTAYYSFYLPVALSMYMVGRNDPSEHAEAKEILLELGYFFQAQDDFLDCFGDPIKIGKVGTDIEEGKCSWLIVNALQLASTEQKAILQENYGKSDKEKVDKVKMLYNDLKLPALYDVFEETSYDKIMSLISAKVKLMPKEIFVWFVNKIYKRAK